MLGGDLGVTGDERSVVHLGDAELEAEPFGILEPQASVLASRFGRPHRRAADSQNDERVVRGDAERDGVHHAFPGPAAARARVLEERDVRARASLLVRVEEVVDGRVVLVDGLLHEPEPEDARVERDVAPARRR